LASFRRIYKCDVCGNIVEVVHGSFGTLVCCGKPMRLIEEVREGAGAEKHVPVVEIGEHTIVRVGEVPHPMTNEHYIEWIEISTEDSTCRQFLKPGMAPEAVFNFKAEKGVVKTYCNIHGLWAKEIKK